MTIATTAAAQTTQGNGATNQFPYAFKIPGASVADQTNVQVTVVDTTVSPATTTILAANQYSITGVGTAGGGAVTYPLVGPNPPAGVFVTVQRVTPFVQATQVPNGGNYNGSVLEAAYDYIVMLTQQLQAQVNRCFQTSVADSSGANPATVQDTALRKNQNAAFDANGNLIAGGAVAGGIAINAAMTGLVQAASVSAAQTFLGMSAYFKTLLGAATSAALIALIGGTGAEGLGANVVDDGAGNLAVRETINAQAVANYAIVAADRNKTVTRTNAGAMADTLPNANTLAAGWSTTVKVLPSVGAAVGNVSITPAAGLIDGLAAIVVQPGKSVKIKSDGVNYLVEWGASRGDYVRLSHTAASGTSGGATTAATQNQRPFNNKDFDTAGICVLAANQFTLQPGTYDLEYMGSLFNSNRHRARLRNITDGTTTLLGVNSADVNGIYSFMSGRFTITAAKTFEVDEYTQNTEAIDGFGVAATTGETEVFAVLQLLRL